VNRVLLLGGAAMAAALSCGMPALAQAPGPPSARAAAQESYARGNRTFELAEQKHDKSLYEAAYLQFAQAFAIYPNDKVLWNLAVTEVKTGRYLDALRHLRAYDVHENVTGQPGSAKRAAYQALYDEASQAVGHLGLDAAPGARVQVDGVDVGTGPISSPIDVAPGTHSITAVFASGKTASLQATVGAGDVARLTLAEPPSDASPPASAASLSAPPAPVAAPSDAQPAEQPPRASWWTTPRYFGLGAGAVAVLGVGAGIAFRVAYAGNQSDASSIRSTLAPGACVGSSLPTACSDLQDKINAGSTNATLSTVSFVVAGVAAAASAGLLLFGGGNSSARSGSVEWSPVVGPGSVGVAGRF
jgi:hypothetical protein